MQCSSRAVGPRRGQGGQLVCQEQPLPTRTLRQLQAADTQVGLLASFPANTWAVLRDGRGASKLRAKYPKKERRRLLRAWGRGESQRATGGSAANGSVQTHEHPRPITHRWTSRTGGAEFHTHILPPHATPKGNRGDCTKGRRPLSQCIELTCSRLGYHRGTRTANLGQFEVPRRLLLAACNNCSNFKVQ